MVFLDRRMIKAGLHAILGRLALLSVHAHPMLPMDDGWARL